MLDSIQVLVCLFISYPAVHLTICPAPWSNFQYFLYLLVICVRIEIEKNTYAWGKWGMGRVGTTARRGTSVGPRLITLGSQ